MAGLATYDPKKIIANIGGVNVQGYVDDTFIEAVRTTDAFTMRTGSDGRTTRTKSNNKSGTITFTLQQASLTNGRLSAIALLDETANAGIVSILIKDLIGTSTYASGACWIRKFADCSYADAEGDRVWVIDCAELNIFVGSNPEFV